MSYLTKEQRRFQSIRNYEAFREESIGKMFCLAGEWKRVTGQSIDMRQAKILWNVAKTRVMKAKKGVL